MILKPATDLAILYTDRGDRRKSPGVSGATIAIFANRCDRRIKSRISGMSYRRLNSQAFAKSARSRDFLPFPSKGASKINQSTRAILPHDFSKGIRGFRP